MDMTEKYVSHKSVFKGRIMEVQLHDIILPNGDSDSREIIIPNGGASVLPVDDEGNVYLVRQFRYPVQGEVLEIPAGKLNSGESHLECARRELEEETGVKGLVMEQIATYGDYDRDPRTRVITTAYMAVVPENAVKVQAGDDAADAVWCEVNLQGVSTEERENDLKCYGGAVSDPEKQMEYHYKLHVKNVSRGLDTEAEVVQTIRGELVREEHFQVEKAGEIAVDHSAIIVQALLTLKKRL